MRESVLFAGDLRRVEKHEDGGAIFDNVAFATVTGCLDVAVIQNGCADGDQGAVLERGQTADEEGGKYHRRQLDYLFHLLST